jgi:hypothetical protein
MPQEYIFMKQEKNKQIKGDVKKIHEMVKD